MSFLAMLAEELRIAPFLISTAWKRDQQIKKMPNNVTQLPVMIRVIRSISLTAYLMIFLSGDMMLLPFGLLLITGIFTSEPIMKILILLADIAFVFIITMSLRQQTKRTWLFEILTFIILLLPLLKIFTDFSFQWFNYFLFLFPFVVFVILFPLSVVLKHRFFLNNQKAI